MTTTNTTTVDALYAALSAAQDARDAAQHVATVAHEAWLSAPSDTTGAEWDRASAVHAAAEAAVDAALAALPLREPLPSCDD